MRRINYLAVMCLGLLVACGPGGEGGLGYEDLLGQVRSPVLSISSLSFTSQTRGTPSSPRSVTVSNNTSNNYTCSLTISAGAPFSFQSTGNRSLTGLTVAARPNGPGSKTDVNVPVVFTPTVVGTASGTVSFSCSSGGTPVTGSADLSGTGTSSATVDTTPLTFGPQKKGTSSLSQQVVVSNSSTAFNITSIAVPAGFTVTPLPTTNAPVQVPAATTVNGSTVPGTMPISVVFSPTEVGTPSGSLTITTDETTDGLSTYDVTLSGTAVPRATQVSPSSPRASLDMAFGDVRTGTQSNPLGVIIYNAGDTDLDLSAISMTPTTQSFGLEFVGGTQSTPLPRGQSRELLVTFSPTDRVDVSASLSITTNEENPDAAGEVVSIPVALSGRGVEPELQISPTGFAFGDQRVGTTSITKLVTVTNIGNGPLEISSAISITQTAPSGTPAFTLVSSSLATPGTLAAGASVDLQVSFTPSANVDYTGTLNLVTTDPDYGTVQIPLTGKGVRPQLQMSPAGFAFSDQRVGTTSDTKLVTVTNNGNGPLEISSAISITQTAPSGTTAFALVSSSLATPGTLAVGASVDLQVSFTPSANVDYTGTLNLATTDPELGTVQIPLSGKGVKPQLQMSPGGFAFGDQRVGTTSVTKLVKVTNIGNGPLDISSAISITQTDPTSSTSVFTLVSSSLATPGRLAAGASVDLQVSFKPTAEVDYTGNVTLVTTDPDVGTVQIPLTGKGVKPQLQMSPTTEFAFSDQRVGTTSATKLVKVTNIGNGPLEISSAISITQTAPSGTPAFTLVSSSLATPGTLAAGASVDLQVSFTPSNNVAYTGNVTLVTTDPDVGTVRIPLTGKGVKPQLQMLPTEFAFGNQRVGTSVTKLVRVTNNGNGPLDITGITRTQTVPTSGDQAFTFVSSSLATPGTLAAGASMDLSVSFLPTAEVDYTGTLNLATTDPDLGTVRLSLSGRGAMPQLVPNQNPLDFGTLRVGTSSSKKVTVTNTGLTPIQITGIVKLGSDAFAHVASSRTIPATLEASGSIELTVSFSPTDVNPAYSGSLTLNTDDPDLKSIAIGLAGGAGVPQLEVTPNPLSFADQRANTSATRPVRVRNMGTGPIDITSISSPSSPFSITSPSNLTIRRTLAAGAFLDITVQFLPPAEGSFSGSFNLTTDYTEISGVTVNLSGKGVMPKLELSPSPLAFSDQIVGTASAPTLVQVRNTGTGPVSISNVNLSGSTAFTLTPTTVTRFDLQPNGSGDLWVVFNPGTKADHSATLSLETDVTSPGITLTGKGTTRLVLDPAETVDFGAVNLRNASKTVTRAIKLTNSSGAPIELKSISSLAGYPFVVRNLSPKTIAPNEVLIFNVDFTAPGEGDFNAILTLETDASNGPNHQLLLKGTGAYPVGKLTLPNGVEIASLDFGGVQTETTKQITARFANVGLVPLTVGQPVMGKTDKVFTYLGPNTLTLQPGTYMDFQVTFRPPLLQSYSDTLTIPSDSKLSPTTLSLLGTGAVPEVKLDRQSIFFGDVRVGSDSQPVAVTINNTGNADVVVQGLSVVGPFVVELPTGITLPTTIKAFNSLSFNVIFKPWEPTSAGADGGQAETTGSVTVITDISGSSLEPVRLSGIGTISVADLPATAISFGNQRVQNDSGSQPVLIYNKGAAALEISSLIFSNEMFSLASPTTAPTSTAPMKIPAGQQGVVSVKFKPNTLGPVSGKLYIISNAYTPAPEVTLSGKGVDGRLTMDPSVVTFANVDVGGAGAQKPVKLINSGEYPLKISTVGTPTDSTSFSILGIPGNLVLEPAQEWSFTVTFNPKERGYFASSAILTSDAVLNPSFSMAMEGTGVSAAAELQPTEVNFGSANLNVSTPYDISIKNAGEKDLLVSKISFENDPTSSPPAALEFSVDSGVVFPLTVKAGQSALVRLRFTPQVLGTRRANVVVYTSVPNGGERRAALVGEGTSSQVGVTHTGLPFGDVLMNSPSEPATITIKNTGTGSLTVKSISLAGPDMAAFTLVKPDPLPVLAAGASLSVSVTLTPPEERTFLAQLLVNTDNSGAPNASVELRGTGVRSQINAEPNPLSFGNQLVYSTSKPRPVTITNNRMELVSIRSITTEGPFDFVLPTGVHLPYSLEGKLDGAATGSNKLDVSVRIKPQVEGAATGKLRITFTDQVLQPIEVELQGTGIPSALSISPPALDFGAIRAGGSAQPLTFYINNLTDDEVELAKPVVLSSSGESFAYDWALLEGKKISARSPFSVEVGYSPLAETLSDFSLNFGTKTPEWRGEAILKLKGRAVARILRVEPESLDFGRVDVDGPIASKEFTITNLSAQPQRVVAKLRDVEGSPFILTAKALADPIPPGGSATISLGFDPGNAGLVENELRISLQDDTVAEAVIPVQGRGRDLTVPSSGCSSSSTEAEATGLMALLALVGVSARRRRRQ